MSTTLLSDTVFEVLNVNDVGWVVRVGSEDRLLAEIAVGVVGACVVECVEIAVPVGLRAVGCRRDEVVVGIGGELADGITRRLVRTVARDT
jgi:hypothetical protein